MSSETDVLEKTNRLTEVQGFDRDLFQNLLKQRKDPDWILENRKKAYAAYETIPMPTTKEEIWRRTDIRALHLDKFTIANFSTPPAKVSQFNQLPEQVQNAIHTDTDYSGFIVTENGETVFNDLKSSLPKGVIFEDLETAVKKHKELIEPYFQKDLTVDYSKFVALHSAFWSGGAFLYVPKSTKVELPLYLISALTKEGLSDFSHLLLVADSLSEVTLIHQTTNTDSSMETFHSGVVELYLKSGSHVRYVDIQDWNTKSWHFSTQRAYIDRDAHLEWVAVGVGSKLAKTDSNTHLRESGTRVDMLGLMYTHGRQHMDYHTLQDHEAPHASSDLLYNAVLRDKSRTVFRGMIRVHKDAQKTDAYQRNNNLNLNEDAHADSIPGLEIEANDVRCTHGSTTGEIDLDQVFYLMSRGVSRKEAERLIIEGFYETVLQRISSELVQDKLRNLLIERQSTN